MLRKTFVRAVLVLIASPLALHASVERLTPEQMREASFLDTVSIPTPGEFFLAVDKQCQPNWSKLLRPSVPASTSDREHLALQLGILAADGFMAIEAQDGQSVKNTARDTLLLAKKLNVSQQIVARSQSISDFADAGNWSRLREELDAMQNDIRLCLLEQKDSPLVVLAMAGSWVRQMDMASNLLASDENSSSTALIVQPEVASRILTRVENLPENSKKQPIVKQLSEGLLTASTLMSEFNSSLPPWAVQSIASTMSAITAAAAAVDSKK
jgi:hypothetical protein